MNSNDYSNHEYVINYVNKENTSNNYYCIKVTVGYYKDVLRLVYEFSQIVPSIVGMDVPIHTLYVSDVL